MELTIATAPATTKNDIYKSSVTAGLNTTNCNYDFGFKKERNEKY